MVKAKQSVENLSPQKNDLYKKNWRLKLNSNESIYDVSNFVISAIKNIDFEDVSRYPLYGKFIDKLASYYNVSDEQILLTTGCNEAICAIIDAYADVNDVILSYTPVNYGLYLNAKIKNINLETLEYKEKYKFDIELIQNQISKNTKIFYHSSPDSLTGDTVRAAEFEILIKEFSDVLFVINCSYINYSDNLSFEDYIDLAKKYDNVAIIKSFSNDYALAGLRLGFVCANKNIIYNLKKVVFPDNVNMAALQAGYAALNDKKHFEQIKILNSNARQLLFEGLSEKGFKPYNSEANFILCDFFDYTDFYYEKFKKNAVITEKFDKSSVLSSCLRITVPKTGGVKYILELLNKKDILIFDLDGIVFDVRDSYNVALIQTFKHFSGFETTFEEIKHIRNYNGYNCDFDAIKHLLEQHYFSVDINDIRRIFQDIYFNPEIKDGEFLIDREKLLICEEKFEQLSKKYDMVIFSERLKSEIDYSLEKFGLDKFFSYMITADDLEKEYLKPNPKGVFEILKHCPYKSIKYIGGNVNDIIAGKGANVETIGVISPGCDYGEMVNNYKHLCANGILTGINDITDFLDENEQNEINLV